MSEQAKLRQVQMYVDSAFQVLTEDEGKGLKPRTHLLDAEAISDAAEALAHASNLLAILRSTPVTPAPRLTAEQVREAHDAAGRAWKNTGPLSVFYEHLADALNATLSAPQQEG